MVHHKFLFSLTYSSLLVKGGYQLIRDFLLGTINCQTPEGLTTRKKAVVTWDDSRILCYGLFSFCLCSLRCCSQVCFLQALQSKFYGSNYFVACSLWGIRATVIFRSAHSATKKKRQKKRPITEGLEKIHSDSSSDELSSDLQNASPLPAIH